MQVEKTIYDTKGMNVLLKNEQCTCTWGEFYEANLEGMGDEELQSILAELTASGECIRNYGAHGVMELVRV